MNKISILIIVSILAYSGFAQQFPLQSQYQFNYPTINPAANGENDFYRARASFREQWVGFSESPISTQILTVTKRFNNNGLGITVFSDKTGGAFNKTGASISYSQRAEFERSDLFFGVSLGTSKFNFGSQNDPAFNTSEAKVPEAAFGVYYVYNDFRLGISVPGLLNKNIDATNSTENTIDRHFYTMLSYQKKINKDWSVYPSILVKTTSNHNQIDGNVNFKIKNTLWLGASYRTSPGEKTIGAKDVFGPSFYLGVDLGRLLSVYSYDISSGDMSSYPTHEVTFGYDFIPEEEVVQEVSDKGFISDKDKDGVRDEDDICPTEYGDFYANGCPDFDKDGVPDKFDLCPHLFGSTKIQGCPELTTAENKILTAALEDLNFGFDEDEVNYESYGALTKLAVLMHSNPAMYLLIEGFASSEGTEKYNLSLSAMRSKAVQNFFIERGVDKNRLVIDFHGEESPLNSNITEQERAKNRRVAFDIKYHLHNVNSANDLKNEYDALLAKIYNTSSLVASKEPIPIIRKDTVIESIEEDTVTNTVANEESIDSLVVKDVGAPIVENNIAIEGSTNRYLVISHVFKDAYNAKNYISSNDGSQYILHNNKYYVFVFSANQREDAEIFRAKYQKDSWILDHTE